MVPIENSTEGAVGRTNDLLFLKPVAICGEVMLSVHQCLMNSSGSAEGFDRIYSHSQSLAQCRGWLSTHYPHVEQITVVSNAEAARLASLEQGAAAVAGPHARVVLLEESLETRLDGVSHNVLSPAAAPALSERVLRALQQDPDALALGELREAADLAVAFRAARSGVRVLAVLEAQDAATALAEAAAASGVPGFGPHAFVAALSQRAHLHTSSQP